MPKHLGKVVLIDRSKIVPFRGQPRTFFPKERLEKLSKSIGTIGQKTPVTVKRIEGGKFKLVDGQCRWIACGMISPNFKIKAWVVEIKDDNQHFIDSFVSNSCRESPTDLDIANALKKIMDMGKTQQEVADMSGYSQGWVGQHLSILKLAPEVINLMKPNIPEEKRLGYSIALLLVNIPSKPLQIQLARTISNMGLSHFHASHLISKQMRNKGVEKTGRRLRREFENLNSFVLKMGKMLELIVDNPVSHFREALKDRELKKRRGFLEQIEKNGRMLEKLGDMIKKILRESL